MLRLFHAPLAPHSRFVRLVLGEKGLEAELSAVEEWGRVAFAAPLGAHADAAAVDFGDLSPDGDAPALSIGPRAIRGAAAIAEYLEETAPGRKLLPPDPIDRAEARRLVDWFCGRFHEDVARPLLEERLVKKLQGAGAPDSERVRAATAAARTHMALIARLCERRRWLAGEEMTLADLAAAAPLSSLDYLNSVHWDPYPAVREWYALIKCRPAFRPLLADRAAGTSPAPHYTDLDF